MTPNLTILYVDSPEQSAAFYEKLLGTSPVERSPTFAMFIFPGGLKLGLWSRHTVVPAATGTPGLFELAIPLADPSTVDAAYDQLSTDGHPTLQTPTDMEFGRTFVITDPDGHRIRFYNPPAR
ncbi:VOC family protein [Rhizobium terricola]|nr:VOC family protein [Rhizobium terricola]